MWGFDKKPTCYLCGGAKPNHSPDCTFAPLVLDQSRVLGRLAGEERWRRLRAEAARRLLNKASVLAHV